MTTHDPLGTVYKLHEGNDPLGLLGVTLRPSMQTNAGRMSATVTISTQDEDRSGDVVVTKGIRLTGHQKNPVALLNHNRELAVGVTADRLGAYTVKMHGEGKLTGEIFFHQNTQLGLDTFRAVEGGVLRGVSIGFLPKAGRVEKRQGRGTVYHEADLIEVSIVPIPDNENAIIEAVHKTFSGKPPCPELAPYIPSLDYRPRLVRGGWDAEAVDKDFDESKHPRDGGKFSKAGATRASKKAHESSRRASAVSREHRRSETDADFAEKVSGWSQGGPHKYHADAAHEHKLIADKERGLGYHEVADAHEEAAKHHQHAHKYREELLKSFGDDLIAKAATFKTAEPKEAEAQYRSGTFYTCPHCEKEMTHAGIYTDDEGKTRHGECRGHVILKPDGPNAQAQLAPMVGSYKSFDETKHPRDHGKFSSSPGSHEDYSGGTGSAGERRWKRRAGDLADALNVAGRKAREALKAHGKDSDEYRAAKKDHDAAWEAHADHVAMTPSDRTAAAKSLATIITKRLGALRRKAMKPDEYDEFAPEDVAGGAGDEHANPDADPNAPPPGPHDDHKAVVDEAVGNTLASIYDKFTSGQIDMKQAIKLFKDCLTHHGNVADLGGGDELDEDDPDAELDLDDDADPDDLDAEEGEDEERDDFDNEDGKPKSSRKKKSLTPRFYHEYTPTMEAWITKSYRGWSTIAAKIDRRQQISDVKLARLADSLLTESLELEPVVKAIEAGALVTKARPADPLDGLTWDDLDKKDFVNTAAG